MKKDKSRTSVLTFGMIGCTIFAAALFVAGFLVPPLGIIDGSVLKAGGEVMGLQAMLLAAEAIATGTTASIKHGQTEATIGNDENGDN